MLISCTSCNSKYLVNSADLKPNGRTVKCANCGNQWYQENISNESDEVDKIIKKSDYSTSNILSSKEQDIDTPTSNLPSTYVREQKPNIINSILVVLFIILLLSGASLYQSLEVNSIVLIKFYIDEFIFNLKLIFNDLASVIYSLVNSLKAN